MPTVKNNNATEKRFLDIFKVICLIVVTILIVVFYAKNPYESASKHPNLCLVVVFIVSFAAFYWTYRSENHQSLSFDFFKFMVMILCFIVVLSVLLRQNSDHWIIGKTKVFVIFLLFAAGCLLLLNMLFFYFSMVETKNATTTVTSQQIIKYQSLFFTVLGYFLFLSFSVLFIILLLTYITSFISFYSSQSQIVRLILSSILLFLTLYLVYRLVSALHILDKSPLLRLVFDTVCYLPCFVFGLINKIVFQVSSTHLVDVVWLLVALFLLALFWILPAFHTYEYNKGGKVLVTNPEHLEQKRILGSYLDLNQGAKAEAGSSFDYQYAVSFWFFVDAVSPNYVASSIQNISILDYGGKPNVLYNIANNELTITMKQRADKTIDVYKQKKVPLQKWNHVVINYTGGTLDIFFNNELVKSIPEIIPFMDYDAMTIGSDPGIHGSICNVMYFNKSLSIQKINELYETVHRKTPPVV